ncbi:hypothetical protein ACFSMW_11985 [Virgibacillus halophilus]|uniref:HAAS signaling domain-containing protein n=1 Tax=Tigheibacillus halophilus TaxID=361280 RepID=UPI00363119B6
MNEEQFLQELGDVIKHLPTEERQDVLSDYAEHFTLGREEGKTEEEIANSLGSPKKIGKEILAVYQLEIAEEKATTGNILRAVWAGIGLGFLNLVLVLGPFIALAAVVISGWVVAVSFVLSPLMIPVNAIFYPGTFEWVDLFFMLVAAGLGILIGIGMFYLTKGFVWVFVQYLKWNTRLVKGGLTHA